MLLSIDRVLQLLAEGKTIDKISELASCEINDVIGVIEEARLILGKYEKQLSRKKIILKKKNTPGAEDPDDSEIKLILAGAELSAVPVSSQLSIYIAGYTNHETLESGIGIIIYDKENRQVGKISTYLGRQENKYVPFVAIIRAMKIARYFNTQSLRIRIDSETAAKQIHGEITIDDLKIKKFRDAIIALSPAFESFKVDSISKAMNDKAVCLAQKSLEQLYNK